jgi:peptidoglycan/LPS O-acetylase OafA/YrhL
VAAAVAPARKAKLPALTGLRCFAALNLVFFHFSNPQWFGWFAPVVDNGYTSVSFFLLLSGFVLAYNYADRAGRGQLSTRGFWLARMSRLYPVYLFSLVVSLGMLREEYHTQTPLHFAMGTILTPLLLQGWHPVLATFWNTPAWTMSTEAFFYLIFPFVVCWKRPARLGWLLALLAALWCAGLVCPALYTWLHPDGELHPDRYTTGTWIRSLKYTPLPHLPSFLFGIVLADLHQRFLPGVRWRLWLGLAGLAGLYAVLYFGARLPYVFLHDGLLMPLFGAAILGLSGENPMARFFGFLPFVFIGESSYCLYLLHFNLWNIIHDSGLLQRTGLIQWDPWLSYVLLLGSAMLTLKLVERPGQQWIRNHVRV